jgi:hypothetical protein
LPRGKRWSSGVERRTVAAVGCSVTLRWRTRRRWWASTKRINRAKLAPGHRSLVHGELVAQDEVSRASWRWLPQRNGQSRSRWSSVLIMGQRLSPDRSRRINHFSAGRGFGEGHRAAGRTWNGGTSRGRATSRGRGFAAISTLSAATCPGRAVVLLLHAPGAARPGRPGTRTSPSRGCPGSRPWRRGAPAGLRRVFSSWRTAGFGGSPFRRFPRSPFPRGGSNPPRGKSAGGTLPWRRGA